MWQSKKKRKTTRIDTLVGRHTVVNGDLSFVGGLHIEGVIRGNVTAEKDDSSMLQLSEHGRIEGEVNVPYLILNGEVRGDVRSSSHVELLSRARITGNVYYHLIEMAIGAEVNGKLVHSTQVESSDYGHEPDNAFQIPGGQHNT